MTTKQILFSALILSAMATITPGTNKPTHFIINSNSNNIPTNIPISARTVLVINATSDEAPYLYKEAGTLGDLKKNREIINNHRKISSDIISCTYCPEIDHIILDSKEDISCPNLFLARLSDAFVKLHETNEQLQQEINILKKSSNK